jgi:hypothetical protein
VEGADGTGGGVRLQADFMKVRLTTYAKVTVVLRSLRRRGKAYSTATRLRDRGGLRVEQHPCDLPPQAFRRSKRRET